ncbi:hypothetical protein T484DRAFT_2794465 [Baffinella frigidus]|nr:hypothetical protein T484DRAFT_2794465 [Cryptophyta sp. CCMP2293]
MAETFFIRGVDSLVGVVPPEWLRKDRLVIDNSRVAVAIHHRPSVVGHCVVFPKVACARLEDVDPDVFCALGMMLPVVKRAVRIATGYRSCGIVLQSGSATGQACAHLYFEVVPSGKSNKNFEFKWDPHGDADAGRQRNVTKAQATAVLRAVRHKLGFLSPCEDWANVLYDTAKITAELVQEPSSVGHFVVSPKELSPDLEDCTREDVGACLWVVPKIAKAMCLTMRTQDFVVCLLNGPEAGQISPHLTFQVVPFSLRKVAVTFDAEAKVKMRDDQSLSLCNALRQVIGEDQLSTAMRMPVASPPPPGRSSRPLNQSGRLSRPLNRNRP